MECCSVQLGDSRVEWDIPACLSPKDRDVCIVYMFLPNLLIAILKFPNRVSHRWLSFLKVFIKRNFVQHFLLHWKDQLK